VQRESSSVDAEPCRRDDLSGVAQPAMTGIFVMISPSVVKADTVKDPAHGCDSGQMAQELKECGNLAK